MKALMLLSVLLSMGVGTYVGLHLLRLARRTHQAPELAIGASLVCYAAVSQLCVLMSAVVGADGHVAVRLSLASVRILSYLVALLGLAVFTWQTFGDTGWRRLLMAAIVAGSLAGTAIGLKGAWVLVQEGRLEAGPQRAILSLCFVVTYAWMGGEALRYHGRMRRRQALGLADAVLTNRVLLWGAGGLVSSLLTLGMAALAWTGQGLAARNPTAALLVTGIGLLNTAIWGLTFTPPEAYLRWVRGSSDGTMAHG